MSTLSAKASDFLAQRRVAVAGVSRTRKDAAANLIYRRFKSRGHQVFPVNPRAERVEGDPCFPDLRSIPGGVDGVVIVTRPQLTEEIVRQCPAAGVKRVWMHRSLVHGDSVSATAAEFLPRERHHGHCRRLPADVRADRGLRTHVHAVGHGHDRSAARLTC